MDALILAIIGVTTGAIAAVVAILQYREQLRQSAQAQKDASTAIELPENIASKVYEIYSTHLVNVLDKTDSTRLAAALDRTLERIPLTEIYVPLKGSLSIPEHDVYERDLSIGGRELNNLMKRQGDDQIVNIEMMSHLPLDYILNKYPGLVILGDPGSGKTTFLKYIAVAFAENAQSERLSISENRVPIFLSIAAYAERLREGNRQLPLAEYFAQYYRDLHGLQVDLAPLFNDALTNGQAIILLDGLDEVKDASERIRISEQVERFWNLYRKYGNRLVMTSRIIGYQRISVEGLTHITLLDFDQDDIRLFLKKWCPVIERAAEKDTSLSTIYADREREELDDAIFNTTAGVRELAANPLLLTLLALIKRKGVRLPEQRVELYEEFVKALVENWAFHRNPDRIFTVTRHYREVERLLASLALWMRETNPEIGTVDQTAIEDWLTAHHTSPNISLDEARLAAQKFVNDLRKDSGLIVERGHKIYGMIHQTLEEYLAGKGLCYLSGTDISPIIEELRKYQMLKRDIWRETTLLAIAHMSIIQRAPDRAAQFVELILKEDQDDVSRGLNVIRAGEAVRDIGCTAITERVWQLLLYSLYSTMTDPSIQASVRCDAGLLLGSLGWLPKENNGLDSLVSIPKGRFLSGKKKNSIELESNYEISRYLVTNLQFSIFTSSNGYGLIGDAKPAWWSDAGWNWRTSPPRYQWQKTNQPDYSVDRLWNNPLQPVVGVTWYEAEAYCNWLTLRWRNEGRISPNQSVRMPTDLEWEKAARGLSGNEFPWGKDFDLFKCNTQESNLDVSTPVVMYPNGTSKWFEPDGPGIFDLTGNVFEWMSSVYREGEGKMTLRGGAWDHRQDFARVIARLGVSPEFGWSDLGFRIVVV